MASSSLMKTMASFCLTTSDGSDGSEDGEGVSRQEKPGVRKETELVARDVYLEEQPIIIEINGQEVTVDTKWATAQTSLARYLRTYLGLTGTKIMCAQAGCGTCVVTATHTDPGTGQEITHSMNSCTTPVFKCHGWKITTVEGLGNTQIGLNETQQRLHDNYGSQCGFCTSGMIMAMNSLLQNNPTPREDDVKEVIDGNLCRCTGYRPIFDAFLSFTESGNPASIIDIEELATKQGRLKCPKTKKECHGSCGKLKVSNQMQYVSSVDGEWFKPESLDDLLALLAGIDNNVRYQLVAGNTGKGVYPNDGPYDQYIDINGITDLHSVVTDGTNLLVGGSVTLNQLKDLMETVSTTDSGYAYCARLSEHLTKVAHNNVRNVGSVAGNLMMKWAHNDFESDVFNLLECVGAQLNIISSTGEQSLHTPAEFLDLDMDKKVVLFISFPKLIGDYRFWTYKVTPRNQNAKAYVNGAMLASVDETDGVVTVIETPRIVLGGISGNFFHAENTENFLILQNLNSQVTLSGALQQMEIDVSNAFASETVPAYKLHLAKALLYKFFIYAVGGSLADPTLASSIGQLAWERQVPQSYQELTTGDGSDAPLHTAVKKLEGEAQVCGEAQYVDDIAPVQNEVFAAYVCGTVGNCDFDPDNIDLTAAMAMPGVIDFVSASDVPGLNNAWGRDDNDDQIFSTGSLAFAGQAVGLMIADSYEHAKDAAKAVELTYLNEQPPILSIADAIEEERRTGKKLVHNQGVKKFVGSTQGTAKGRRGKNVQTVSGSFEVGGQYHFHMETQTCIAKPLENGHFDIRSATQHMDGVQNVVAKALGINSNKVDVQVRRLGGAYGGKIYCPNGVAAACAVAANKLNRPVRLVLDLQTNMEMLGKRVPYLFNYTAQVDDQTLAINSVTLDAYCDVGFSMARTEAWALPEWIQNSYRYGEFTLVASNVVTNTPTCTPCRAPSSTQCHAWAETLMEHIATNLGVDPLDFRLANLLQPNDALFSFDEDVDNAVYTGPNPLPDMIDLLSASEKGNLQVRKTEVAEFNANNAFRKRGISIVPMTWFHQIGMQRFTAQVTAYDIDGTVAVTIGGIEIGQGINTKVAQVVASKLGITDISLVSVKSSNNMVSSNNSITGGSKASDCCALAASIACDNLIASIDNALGGSNQGPTDWAERVSAAHDVGADLTGRHQANPAVDGLNDYVVYAVCITEVEIDVLTGEKNVRRVDLMEDTGNSISPLVDLTQCEGAFVMGQGLWLSEEITFDATTGRLQNFDTWTYKPPSSQDIPENFRTYLYDSGLNVGIFSSKATGEPPFLMGFSVMLALRNAINAARADNGLQWYQMDGPAMNDKVQVLTGITSQDFYI